MAKINRVVKKGDFVKVYEDPVIQQHYEGIGKVCKVHHQDEVRALLEVEFRDDPGQQFYRTVIVPAEIVRGWE